MNRGGALDLPSLSGGRGQKLLAAAGILAGAARLAVVAVVSAYAEQNDDKDNDPAAVVTAKVEA